MATKISIAEPVLDIIKEINVEAEIEQSFSGALSTAKLITHFSAVSTPAECMDNYTSYCHSQRGWKRKCDIGNGKSRVACGWQALQKWSAMVLLSELSIWDEKMQVAERNALVKRHWLMFGNVVAKRCFRNSVVFNNMASMRCKPPKEAAGKDALPDLSPSAEDVVRAEQEADKSTSLLDGLAAVQAKLSDLVLDKKISKDELQKQLVELSADIEIIVSSLK